MWRTNEAALEPQQLRQLIFLLSGTKIKHTGAAFISNTGCQACQCLANCFAARKTEIKERELVLDDVKLTGFGDVAGLVTELVNVNARVVVVEV